MEETKKLLHELIDEAKELREEVHQVKVDRTRDRKVLIVLAVVSAIAFLSLIIGARAFLVSSNEARERSEAGCAILNIGIARDEVSVQALLSASAQAEAQNEIPRTPEEEERRAAALKTFVEGQGMTYDEATGMVTAPRIDCVEYIKNPSEALKELQISTP